MPVFRPLAVVLFVGLGAFGCSGTSSTAAAAPPGPPAIALAAYGCAPPQPDAAPRIARVLVGGAAYVAVDATLTNVTLKVPGGCAGAAQCGQLVVAVTLDGATTTTRHAATAHVDLAITSATTHVDVAVTVQNDDGTPMNDAQGVPLRAAVVGALVVEETDPACTPPPALRATRVNAANGLRSATTRASPSR